MRQIEGLSAPAPKQVSPKKRSPLIGSTRTVLGQVSPDAKVLNVAPVTGSILRITPEWKPEPVAPRATYMLPSLPNTGRSRVRPTFERMSALDAAPPVC